MAPTLTGSFASLPTTRDGAGAIVARIQLSEEISLGFAKFQGHAAQATNGEVTRIRLDYSERRFRWISGERLLRVIQEVTE